jgi:cob(I)alamin adenosyltransferase
MLICRTGGTVLVRESTQNHESGCRRLVGDSGTEVFASFFKKKRFPVLQTSVKPRGLGIGMTQTTRVVTRGGDTGETSLGRGARVPKNNARVEAYGTVDEVSALLGVLRTTLDGDAAADAMLRAIQIDLFHLCADLHLAGEAGAHLRITDTALLRIESELDALNEAMPRLANFILSGGTRQAAFAHLARTVTRRAERRVVTLAQTEDVNPEVLRYLNRLSDYLFVLARRLNNNGAGDDLWAPGGVR